MVSVLASVAMMVMGFVIAAIAAVQIWWPLPKIAPPPPPIEETREPFAGFFMAQRRRCRR